MIGWARRLREGLNAPFADVDDMTAEETRWWETEKTEVLRRTRWMRFGQSLAASIGPALPGIVKDPARFSRPEELAFIGFLVAAMYLLTGIPVGRVTLRMAKKELLPQYRLRRALLADLKSEVPISSGAAAEPASTRRLERDDVA